jgi:hypothetical protein
MMLDADVMDSVIGEGCVIKVLLPCYFWCDKSSIIDEINL